MALGNIEIVGIGAGLLSSLLFYFINPLKLSPERRLWISLASIIPFALFFVFAMFLAAAAVWGILYLLIG